MSSLKNLLFEYKDLTLKAIEVVRELEKLNQVLFDRQLKIDEIDKLSFARNEFVDIANELNLFNLDKELKNKVQKEKVQTKKALDNVRKLRQARRSYTSFEGTPKFLSETT